MTQPQTNRTFDAALMLPQWAVLERTSGDPVLVLREAGAEGGTYSRAPVEMPRVFLLTSVRAARTVIPPVPGLWGGIYHLSDGGWNWLRAQGLLTP